MLERFLLFARHFCSKYFLLIVNSLDRKCDALFAYVHFILLRSGLGGHGSVAARSYNYIDLNYVDNL